MNQSKLIPLLIIIVGFGAGYFYHGQAAGDYDIAPLPIAAEDQLVKFETVTFDDKILSNSAYVGLQIFGEVPVSTGNPGKSNLFSQ